MIDEMKAGLLYDALIRLKVLTQWYITSGLTTKNELDSKNFLTKLGIA